MTPEQEQQDSERDQLRAHYDLCALVYHATHGKVGSRGTFTAADHARGANGHPLYLLTRELYARAIKESEQRSSIADKTPVANSIYTYQIVGLDNLIRKIVKEELAKPIEGDLRVTGSVLAGNDAIKKLGGSV